MFSATFPKNIEVLAKKILVSPIEIVVGNRFIFLFFKLFN